MAGEETSRFRLNFNSPKAAPAVLTIGTALWRLLAFLQNIDFVLSVKEEKIAMSLQLLLDYGWIVLIIAGIVWFLGANTIPVDTSKVHWGMVFSASLIAFMCGALIAVYATGSLPMVLNGWGADSGSRVCSVTIDTSRLVGLKDKYRVIGICGMIDASTDPQDDDRIAVSKPFNITGQPLAINVPYGDLLLTATNATPSNFTVGLWHTVALIPKDVNVSEIKHVSDVEKRNGRVIAYPPAGGFGNPVMGTRVVPASSPAPSSSADKAKAKLK
jgi:hypothetical protein